MKKNNNKTDYTLKDLALIIAVNCVRNTVIENYHCGTSPSSKTGDYSDVKVVSPYGEIPWNQVSRLNDEEMKAFNKEVANKLYTFLQYMFNHEYEDDKDKFLRLAAIFKPDNWDDPEMDKMFVDSMKVENIDRWRK